MSAAKCLAVLAVLCTVGHAHANSFASGAFHMFHLPCIAGVCLHHSTWHTYASCQPTVVGADVNGVTTVRARADRRRTPLSFLAEERA
jgi:hypothetical protein